MKYLVVLMLVLNFLFAESFDVAQIKESKLSSYMRYSKLNVADENNLTDADFFKNFEKVTNSNFGLNFENSIWTEVELTNSSKNGIEIFVMNTIPLTEKIDVLVFENNRLIQKTTLGVLSNRTHEQVYNRFSSIELLIKPAQEYKILTKLYNPKGRIDAEWIAMSKEAFHYFLFKDSLIWGMIFGVFFVLLILHALFYFIFKNKSFISYLAYMFLFFIYLFINNGFATLFFGHGYLALVLSHISGYSIFIFYILFLDAYLNLSKNNKYSFLLKTIYIYGFYLALTSWIIIFSPIVYLFDDFYFIACLVMLFILLYITTREAINTKNIPIFYFFGQLSLILGYLFLLLSSFKFIPTDALNQQFLGIFASFEMVFFTLAIFSKIKKTVEIKERNEKLILSQSHFYTIGQTLKNIAHQWKVPAVRIGTLITELEAMLYEKQIEDKRMNEIFVHMRNSTDFMRDTITEFSNFYSNDCQDVTFKIIDEIHDVQMLLIEKMKFLNFEILYDNTNIQNIELLGNPKTFGHICMIIIDNALDISNQRQIKNPWIKISIKSYKNKCIIDFEDNCNGITQKPIDKIFELSISSYKEKNRGIGLSIATMLVERKMNGKILAQNTLHGALFSIVLPITPIDTKVSTNWMQP